MPLVQPLAAFGFGGACKGGQTVSAGSSVGGAGAVWGSSEVVCLRHQNNRRLWRGIAGGMGIIFFGFYLQERIDQYKKLKNNGIQNKY